MKRLLAYFWIFYLSSFIGSIIETIWCYIRYKKIESRRSTIYEYIIPIYGFAGLLFLLIIHMTGFNKWYQLFIIGFFVSSIVEFFCSLFQEKVFKSISWDYNDFWLNLYGRVNLVYSLIFGILCTVLYKYILNPLYSYLILIDLNTIYLVVSFIFITLIIVDSIISGVAALRWEERRRKIKRSGKFWSFFDKVYNDKRMYNIYPNVIHLDKIK